MSKLYTVTLPVKPYIKKYVETIEGTPINFKGSSMLCKIVRAYMENKNSTGLSLSAKKAALSLRTTKVEIVVPIARMHVIGTALSDDGILQINAFLQDCFDNAVVHFVKEYVKKEGRYKGYKEAIETFARIYNIEIETDITFDGLQKMEYRSRKKEENYFSKIVPSL